MRGPRRVLVVTAMYPTDRTPGRGTFVQDQVEGVRAMGLEVDVLLLEGDRSRLAYLAGMARVLVRTLQRDYDVVHAHHGLAGLASVLRWRTPLVITLHGSDVLGARWQRWASRVASLLATRTIAVSRQIQAVVPSQVIPCGVDRGLFRPRDRGEARARLGIDRSRLVVLFPYGPAYDVKRPDLAAAVVARLRSLGHPADLLRPSGVPHREMVWYYAASDVLLLCSDREGAPVTVKEAVACGRPVVSTDVGDVREVAAVAPMVRVVPQDVPALADAILEAVSAPAPQPAPAFDRYAAPDVARAVLEVYASALQ